VSIVVSDTSPVRALANLGLLEILGRLYGVVVVPHAVAAELSCPPEDQIAVDLSGIPFVIVQPVSNTSITGRFLNDLDRGESEALALAIELRADLILIDELAGRAIARNEGLDLIGVLGILLEAKHQGLIEVISPKLEELQEKHRFFIGEKIRREVLRLAGE
jgi:uncharacterized protein